MGGRGSSNPRGGGGGKLTTKAFEDAGFRHWQKNGKDRIYVNVDMHEEVDERELNRYFNRYERQNLSVYWDVPTKKLVISHGSDEAKAAAEEVVRRMLKQRSGKR